MTDLTYTDLDADGLYKGEWDALVRQGTKAREAHDQSQWTIGAIALQVMDKWSHKGALKLFAEQIGISERSAQQYRKVAETFPDDPNDPENEQAVRFSIARAASTTDDPADWVNAAEEFGWSTDTLLSKIKEKRAEREAANPKPAQTAQEPADEPEASEPGSIPLSVNEPEDCEHEYQCRKCGKLMSWTEGEEHE